jgi:predicted MPP superfamily phosphohydrolase
MKFEAKKTIAFEDLTQGSEKQIAWAEDIREECINDLVNKFFAENTISYDIAVAETAEEIEALAEKYIIVLCCGNDKLRPEKEALTTKYFSETIHIYNRIAELAARTDAKFWIENRTNTIANHMNKGLREFVQA